MIVDGMITVKREKTAAEQVRLHVIAAVARAVLDHTVSQGPPPVPQLVPAGLGSSTPARTRADVSGSVQVERLSAAATAAAVTGRERELRRVQTWQRNLNALDEYLPVTAQERRESAVAARQRQQLERESRRGAREALAALERYLNWLGRHLAATPGERDRLAARLSGAQAVLDHCAVQRLQRRIPRDQLDGARALVQIRRGALAARDALEQQHRDRDRLLASARARVAGSKKRVTTPVARQIRGACYLVTVPALTVATPSAICTIPTQRLELDLRAGMCSTEHLDALRLVRDGKTPTRTESTGHTYRRGDIAPEVWAAWELLGAMAMGSVAVTQRDRELAA